MLLTLRVTVSSSSGLDLDTDDLFLKPSKSSMNFESTLIDLATRFVESSKVTS